MQNEINDVIKYWLEIKNIDGLRIDALANLYENIDFKDEPIKPNVNIDLNVRNAYFILSNLQYF